ncbi:MAG: HAMP domain-containing histidine kinase [Actinomycetia bacterium]|nr:HAMP domain-containing histidine kinase [Actinomycetes bacterium]
MRRRIIGVALASVALALLIFSVPLGLVVRHLYVSDEIGELEQAALRAAVRVGPNFSSGDPAELPAVETGGELALYDQNGTRISGQGPAQADAAVLTALSGSVGQSQTKETVVVAVPVASDENVVGAVRAASEMKNVRNRVWLTWVGMAAVGALAIAFATALAGVLAKRLSVPLGKLAETSQRLGDGEFTVRTDPTGIPEIDQAGAALNVTASRLGEVVDRERLIAENASHQLRTPLTGLRASLEHALVDPSADLRLAAASAIASARTLEATINDIIGLTRGDPSPAATIDVAPVVEQLQLRWHGRLAAVGRPLRVEVPREPMLARAAPPAIEQILDVLLDNALRHGRGAVVVSLRAAGDAVAIDVADDGPGIAEADDVFARGESGTGGSGIGLALARELATDQSGRLLLTRREPAARFTLLLPGP